MTKQESIAAIKTLTDKATKAEDSTDALRFSQAAVNISNATIALNLVDRPVAS